MPTVLATWTSSLTAMRTRRDITQVCILSCLARAFPGDKFIAEETGGELLAAGSGTRAAVMDAVGRHSALRLSETDALGALDLGRTGAVDGWSSSGRTWVLDPVDGTKGFLRGDQFAVALSLLDGGVPVLGMLGCPALGDAGSLFWAERGHGASWSTCTDPVFGDNAGLKADDIFGACAPLRVTTPSSTGLVRCEAFEAQHTNFAVAESIGARLGVEMPPVRMDGQCKYGLIARGECHIFTRLPREGYVEKIWDHAAGSLIVEEAGGRVTDTDGRPLDFSLGETLDPSVTGIVASNGAVHDALLLALAEVI